MRHILPTMGSVAPQPPGRTPHSASRRASGTTQPQAPQCVPARLRHDVCPGAEDSLPHHNFARLRRDQAQCWLARLRHDAPRGRPEMEWGGDVRQHDAAV